MTAAVLSARGGARLWLSATIAGNALANLLFKQGTGWFGHSPELALATLAVGIALTGGALVCFGMALRHLALSTAYPAMVGTNVVIAMIVGPLFFGESLSLSALGALALLVTGLALLAPPREG